MEFTHIDEKGNAKMVDVSRKENSARVAVAMGNIYLQKSTIKRIIEGDMPKGDVFSTARIAGIMGAKNTAMLIPMCHNVPLDSVEIELKVDEKKA
jgi:cyclic pyranopterin phosphate synthase